MRVLFINSWISRQLFPVYSFSNDSINVYSIDNDYNHNQFSFITFERPSALRWQISPDNQSLKIDLLVESKPIGWDRISRRDRILCPECYHARTAVIFKISNQVPGFIWLPVDRFVIRTVLDAARARNTFSRGYSQRYLIIGFNCFLESLFPA